MLLILFINFLLYVWVEYPTALQTKNNGPVVIFVTLADIEPIKKPFANPRAAAISDLSIFAGLNVYLSVYIPWPNENMTDLKFATHTSLNVI